MALNPAFKRLLEEEERHWLERANKVLTEIIEEIRTRITKRKTTMGDLVKALDVISDKYNIELGKPTSIEGNYHLHAIKGISDPDLDKRISELEKQFLPSGGGEIVVSPLKKEIVSSLPPPEETAPLSRPLQKAAPNKKKNEGKVDARVTQE